MGAAENGYYKAVTTPGMPLDRKYSQEAIRARIDDPVFSPDYKELEDLQEDNSLRLYQKNEDGVIAEILAEPELLRSSRGGARRGRVKGKWIHTGKWIFRMSKKTRRKYADRPIGVDKRTEPTDLSCTVLLNPSSWFPPGSLTTASRWLNYTQKKIGGKGKLHLPKI